MTGSYPATYSMLVLMSRDWPARSDRQHSLAFCTRKGQVGHIGGKAIGKANSGARACAVNAESSASCLIQKKPREFWDPRGFYRDPDAPT